MSAPTVESYVSLAPETSDHVARLIDGILRRGDIFARPDIEAITEVMNALYALGNDTDAILCTTLLNQES